MPETPKRFTGDSFKKPLKMFLRGFQESVGSPKRPDSAWSRYLAKFFCALHANILRYPCDHMVISLRPSRRSRATIFRLSCKGSQNIASLSVARRAGLRATPSFHRPLRVRRSVDARHLSPEGWDYQKSSAGFFLCKIHLSAFCTGKSSARFLAIPTFGEKILRIRRPAHPKGSVE